MLGNRSLYTYLHHEKGFTLVEVLVSILIFAFCATATIGLQSALIDRAIRNRNERQAMLIARSILAIAEVLPENIPNNIKHGSAYDLLDKLNGTDGVDEDDAETLKSYNAELYIEDQDIPIVGRDLALADTAILKKIQLIISWGSDDDEQFETVYYAQVE